MQGREGGTRDWNISLSSTIFLGTTCLPSQGGKRFFAFKKKCYPRPSYKKQVLFLLLRNIHSCYFLQLSSEAWRLWVKQSDQSKTKTQTKRKVNCFRPPPPPLNEKNIACWRKVENAIFLQTRKNNITLPLPPQKNYPREKKESSPVQILVHSSPQSSPGFLFSLPATSPPPLPWTRPISSSLREVSTRRFREQKHFRAQRKRLRCRLD